MAQVFLHIPKKVHQAVWTQLLPRHLRSEKAGFMYVRHESQDESAVFEYVDWYLVPSDGFLDRSRYHFELTDETRARVIKQAHDLGTSLVEFHSHAGRWSAAFSASDLLGFQEFVPHVWWRLKGKPYLALVVTRTSFDGLAWLSDPRTPQHIDGIIVEGYVLTSTRLSPLKYYTYDHYL